MGASITGNERAYPTIGRNERSHLTAGRIDKETGKRQNQGGKGKGKTKDKNKGNGFSLLDQETTAEGAGGAGPGPEPPSNGNFDDLKFELGSFRVARGGAFEVEVAWRNGRWCEQCKALVKEMFKTWTALDLGEL